MLKMRSSTIGRAGTTAADIMVRRVYTASPEQTVHTVTETLIKRKVSGMPVVDAQKRVVGVVSEKDCIAALMRAVHDRLPPSRVQDVMTPPVTVSPDTHLMTIAHHFSTRNIRRLPVVDAEGCLLGQISRRDLLSAARRIFDQSPSREVAVLYLSALERDASAIT